MRCLTIRGIWVLTWSAMAGFAASVESAEPTTRPRDIAPQNPPVVSYAGPIADMSRPAYIPAFARVENVPALQAERDYAQMHTLPPGPIYLAYPYPFSYSFPCGRYGYRPAHGWVR